MQARENASKQEQLKLFAVLSGFNKFIKKEFSMQLCQILKQISV